MNLLERTYKKIEKTQIKENKKNKKTNEIISSDSEEVERCIVID